MAKSIKGVDKIIKARSSLLLAEPWYGVPALSLGLVPKDDDPRLWAMGTDGRNLYFKPQWVMDATMDEIKGVIVHEIWHIWSKHDIRMGKRDFQGWNIACDYAINPNIRAAGYKLPDGALDDRYAGMAAEEIYDKLPKGKGPGGDREGDGGWNIGVVLPNPDLQDQSPKQVESERNVQIHNWHQAAKRAGKIPAELQRIVDELNKARLPWREILARFVDTHAANDYDHTVCDPEYARYSVYMPSVHSEELGIIVDIGDTSGSINNDQLKTQVSEIQGMLRQYPGSQLLCIWVDTAVHGAEWVTADDVPLNIHPKGGGGTSFRPGFEYLEAEQIMPKCVIYMTDGECDDFPDDPGVPVLWMVLEKNDRFNPPFGEVVTCDFE